MITWYRVTVCINCGKRLRNIQPGTEGYYMHDNDSIYCADGKHFLVNDNLVVDYETEEKYKKALEPPNKIVQ